MDNFKSMLANLATIALSLYISVGWIYWLWLSFKVGGFAMFFCGFFPLTAPIASIVGGWSLLFGVPDWVVDIFAT